MTYGESARAELPISVVKIQEANGEEHFYELVIDGVMDLELCIIQELSLTYV